MLAPSCNVGVNVKNETDAGTRGEKKPSCTLFQQYHLVCQQLIVEMQSKLKASALIALPDRAYLDWFLC